MAVPSTYAQVTTRLLTQQAADALSLMCIPHVQARVDIMKIHMADKQVDPGLDLRRLARACAGFTGAEIMGLMNRAATIAVRARQKMITEDIMFQVRLATLSAAGLASNGCMQQTHGCSLVLSPPAASAILQTIVANSAQISQYLCWPALSCRHLNGPLLVGRQSK